MPSLFDSLNDLVPQSNWTPDTPPSLLGINEVYFNFETTGLKWWDGDRPISFSLGLPDGRTFYCLCDNITKEWALRELRGKNIVNLNTKFECHMARVWGVDFEGQGNTVSDVSHYAALLDDHRFHLSLDSLILDYLHETPMRRLDESRMVDYQHSEIAPRSMYNVQAVRRLKEVMWPMLDAQDLQRVRALEDKVIYPTVEMERNGTPIDLDLLEKWLKQSKKQLETLLWQLSREVGFHCNPDSPKDQERVFNLFNIPLEYTTKGSPSFTDIVLKRIDHPTIKLMRKLGKLTSLRNKFLLATKNSMGSDGVLRYALHQLRRTKDENEGGGEAGTVTGRFSSTELIRGVGCNIQQRSKPAKQRVSWGYDEKDSSHDDEIYLVRKLHIPRNGLWLSSDGEQIEYRVFASYAKNPRVLEAYRQNPRLKFHDFILSMLKPYRPDLTYGRCKDCNFAKVYGAGIKKLALMFGYITQAEFTQLVNQRAANSHPKLRETVEIDAIYNQELPEVGPLLREASHLAMSECDEHCRKYDELHQRFEHRGYVKDLLGRRSRFIDNARTHKALNCVIQPGAATIMKQKLVELHEARKETQFVLRITQHDEVGGDIPDKEHAKIVADLLDRQSFPQLRVPILWDTKIGANWAECK